MKTVRVMLACGVLLAVTQAWAQSSVPPDRWHPYRGGINCVQVADAQGNFNCSPLVTINPATGALSFNGGVSATAQQFFGGIYLGPSGQSPQVLGAGDLVIASTPSSVAKAGPLVQGVVLRVRPSPVIPGYCRVVVAAGNGLGEYTFTVVPPGAFGPRDPSQPSLSLQEVTDFPGGPLGC